MDRILIVSNSDGGLYNFRKELIQAFIEKKFEVILLSPFDSKKAFFTELGCKCINLTVDRRGINPFSDLKTYQQIKKTIKQFNPIKVMTYTVKPNIYGGYACRKKNIPYFCNITGLGTAFQGKGLLNKLIVKMYKVALKKVCKVFFENESNRNVFVENKIVDIDKTVVLNGAGVNLETYPYAPINEGKVTKFIFVARIMREKGVNELFECAERIKSQYGDNVTFDFYGGHEEDYSEKIKNLENVGVINYKGIVDNLNEIYCNYDCLILPSYHEGMANVLLEAASCGRPLIASDIAGCKEAIVDGENGYLVKVKNAEDLYDKLVQFIKLSYDDKVKMGIQSRKIMEQCFDKKLVVEKTLQVFMGCENEN